MDQRPAGGARRLLQMFKWWYICIGVGFALLAARNWIAGSGLWAVTLRFIIAAGFIILGLRSFRAGR